MFPKSSKMRDWSAWCDFAINNSCCRWFSRSILTPSRDVHCRFACGASWIESCIRFKGCSAVQGNASSMLLWTLSDAFGAALCHRWVQLQFYFTAIWNSCQRYQSFLPYFWHKVQRSSLQRQNWDLILDHASFIFSTFGDHQKKVSEIAGCFDDFSRSFLRSFRSFIRFVLRYGHPGGDPGLRYRLRSLRSYIRYENSLQNHQKSGISLTFFEIPTLKK